MNIRKGLNKLGEVLCVGGALSLALSIALSVIMAIVTMLQATPPWRLIIASALCFAIGSFLEGATS